MKFTIALLVALAVCATALPVSPQKGQDVIGAKVTDVVTNGQTTVAIDVTNDFTDSLGDHKLEVLLDLTVSSGVASINQQPVAANQVLALRIQATVSETDPATGAVVRQPRMVTVQVGVQASQQIVQGVVVDTLIVQELIQEIDGTLLTQVGVRETIITLDESGNEASRVDGDAKKSFLAPSTPSQVQVGAEADASPSTSTTAPADSSDSDSSSSSDGDSSSDSSSSDSDSDSDSTGQDRSDEKQRVRRLAKWLGKVLVVAAVTFVSAMVLIMLLRCVRRVCCGVPQTRVVSGSKLHYVPLAVDEVLDFKTTKETSVAI